ncbi:MAG: carbohydrate kinase family protein [Anaerolineales bacterium]|nr:carbohydrate kinase family protein [Anaerolineales bacterium]
MIPTFAIAGKLARDYLLPPAGEPILNEPGGDLLYAAGGLIVWDAGIGLIARVNRDYPQDWLAALKERGLDISGVRVVSEIEQVDMRRFIAYTEANERSFTNAVSHFARRQLTFPKSLLGYHPRENGNDPRETEPLAPAALDVPNGYRSIRHVHICPFDFTSQSQMVSLFKGGSDQTICLDPDPSYMKPVMWRELRLVLQGLTAFHPSEEELRALFWGETHDLWEMAQKVSEHGPEIVVIKRGPLGQLVYDSVGKHRYEIPAYSSRVADPTGAGDAFCGGFLAGFQRTNDPLMAALYGNISASLKVEGVGPFFPLEVLPGLAKARLHALTEMAREV